MFISLDCEIDSLSFNITITILSKFFRTFVCVCVCVCVGGGGGGGEYLPKVLNPPKQQQKQFPSLNYISREKKNLYLVVSPSGFDSVSVLH